MNRVRSVAGPVSDERVEHLVAEPVSARVARRFVLEALAEWGLDSLADDASLLVSEVVTNSLPHARSPIDLRVLRSKSGVRIEVHDQSPTLPSPRTYDGEAVTGRGLEIVRCTASNWGAEQSEAGKVVWFELGTTPSADQASPAVTKGPAAPTVAVSLLGAPVALAKTTFQYGDAMLRELALLSFSGESGLSMARLGTPDLDLSAILLGLEQAGEAGPPRADIELDLPAGSSEAALARLALIDEADRMAREGRLLIPASLPEITHCRLWMMGQIVSQCAGEAPTPWEPQDHTQDVERAQGLLRTDEHLLGLDMKWTIVADQDNYIDFVGDAVGELLRWVPSELAGRRLTTIVPPSLHEAHLVGFTRYQLTRKPVLMGQPINVDAIRSDGSPVGVNLLLEEMPRRDGKLRYRATMRPVSSDSQPEGQS